MRGVLLDIEGTTTPVAFVYEVLFPFARAHAREHLRREDLSALKREHEVDEAKGLEPPAWSDEPEAYVHWLMDRDRKSTALKNLQGKIWLEGYKSGMLRGEVFPDVPPALERWRRHGLDVRIFSSGSVLAQRLLFSSTPAGDLTMLLNGFFDTTTGPKTEAASYSRIAAAFGCAPPEILFVSDVSRELDAARQAGMQTALCLRPGNSTQPAHGHRTIASFDELNLRATG
jgi:enolase-phosphatase E1